MRFRFKVVSTLLVVVLLTQLFPLSVWASDIVVKGESGTAATNTASLTANTAEGEPYVVNEVESLRSEDQKHYRLSDGSYIAVSYDGAVHYQDDTGMWKEIDNTLSLKTFSIPGAAEELYIRREYQTVNGREVRRFAESLQQDGYLFSIASGEYRLDVSAVLAESDIGETAKPLLPPEEQLPEDEDPSVMPTINVNAESELDETQEPILEAAEPLDPEGEQVEVSENPEQETTEDEQTIPTEEGVTSEAPVVKETLPVLDEDTEIPFEKIEAVVLNPQRLEDTMTPEEIQKLPLSQQAAPQKFISKVSYADVWDDTDIVYETVGFNVKENIVVNAPQAQYTYEFQLEMDGLLPVENEDGSISLCTAQGSAVFLIPAPLMTDANGAQSEEVHYTLTPTQDGYQLTVVADPAWINAPERAFPVTIDPSVYLEGNNINKNIITSYVSSNSPTTPVSDIKRFVRAGRDNVGTYKGFIYFKNLPEIPDGCVVTSAQLNLYKTLYYGSTFYATLYEGTIQASYSDIETYLTGLTWNRHLTEISYGGSSSAENRTALSNCICRPGNAYLHDHYWDITRAAQTWYHSLSTAKPLLVMDGGGQAPAGRPPLPVMPTIRAIRCICRKLLCIIRTQLEQRVFTAITRSVSAGPELLLSMILRWRCRWKVPC